MMYCLLPYSSSTSIKDTMYLIIRRFTIVSMNADDEQLSYEVRTLLSTNQYERKDKFLSPYELQLDHVSNCTFGYLLVFSLFCHRTNSLNVALWPHA